MANKTATCPVEGCKETTDPRGMHGHLRFKHGITGEEADELNPAAADEDGGDLWKWVAGGAFALAGAALLRG